MERIRATATWSPAGERYCLWAEASDGKSFVPEPFGQGLGAILMELDGNDQETGRIAGIEIVGFLAFDAWDDIPRSAALWVLPDSSPTTLPKLLQHEQKRLRQTHPVSRN